MSLVEAQGDTLIGRTKDVSCDLPRFLACLRTDRLAEAAELLAAGFLSALPDRPSREFEDWVSGRSLSLRSALRDRATAVWSGAEPSGNWRLARLASEVLLRLDPVDERALRRVLLSTAMAGHVHEAEATYTSFVERAEHPPATDDGPAWRPDQETAQLVTRIRTLCDRGGLYGALGDEPEPDAPLCGRQSELATLQQVVSAPPEEGAVTALIVGEGGAGKTRLVEESLIAAHLSGLRVLRGRSSEFEREIPLNPLLEALSDADVGTALGRLDDPWRTVMLSLLPQFQQDDRPLPDLGYIQPGSIPRRLYEAVHRLLLEVVRDGPVCLFIDDFHWADQTSLTVLDFLRRRWKSGGLVIVLAARPEATKPGSSTERYLRDLPASRGVRLIGLEELSASAAEELIKAVAARSLPEAVISDLRALGGHNPFFLIELTLEHLAGRLSPPRYRVDEIPVPRSIRQLFHQRLDGLAPDARRAADLLAVADRPIRLKDLASLAGTSETEVVSSVEELVRLRLIRWQSAGAVPRHPLVRESLYQALPEATKASLHGQIAEFLLRGSNPPVDELALHFDRAGERDSALKYATEAADRAETAGAVAEALQYLEIAARNQPDDERNAELLSRLAHLNYLHRNFQEAARLLAQVSTDQRSKGHLAAALESDVRLTDSNSHFVALPLGDFIERLEEIKSEARKEELWEVLAEALDVELHLLDRIPDSVRARRVFEEARECVARGSTIAKVRGWSTLAIEIYYGDPAVALEAARRAVDAAFSGKHSSVLPKALDRLLLVLMHQGLFETEEGRRALGRATELAAKSGDLYFKFNVRSNEGVWCLDTGQLDRAGAAFARAAEVLEQTDVDWPSLALRLNLGELSLARSDFSEAAQAYAECRERLGPSTPRWAESVIHAGSGLSALESGDLSTSRACERALEPDPDDWVFDPYLVTLFRARLLQRQGKRAKAADVLRHCADKLEGRLVLSWVRLKLAEARMLAGYQNSRAALVAEEGIEVAERLGLGVRKRQFQQVLERSTSLL